MQIPITPQGNDTSLSSFNRLEPRYKRKINKNTENEVERVLTKQIRNHFCYPEHAL